MNIKEAIERGLYPTDDKGRALVPLRDGGTFTVAATDHPQTEYGKNEANKPRPIVGWDHLGYIDSHTADSSALLPPPPNSRFDWKLGRRVFNQGD